ncbi:MAG: GNAT family N-acetyltransferase [Hyphomicrobiales bacterium]|nr:MAG: GNAT family N-acetyltransferase [Hyphomicrobiales bacterium]
MPLQIRTAKLSDISQIQVIYTQAVLSGTASFELEPPDIDEMVGRFEALRADGLPYIVAQASDGQILGYAYAGFYRTRPAYRFTVEDSVYLAEDARGKGLGTTLLKAVIAACEQQGFRQMIAIIGDSKHLASIHLHEKLGFEVVGTFRDIGWKQDNWLDTVLMQRVLGEGSASKPFE